MNDDVQHLFDLIGAYTRRLRQLELQQAVRGLNTPPETKIEIADIQTQIKDLTTKITAPQMKEDQFKDTKEISKTILVVDDDAGIRNLICNLLEETLYKTIQACNGVEALHIMNSEKIDLVLLDIQMPGLGGHEFLTKINERNISTRVIVISALPDIRGTAHVSLKSGAINYLPKPFDEKALLDAIAFSLEFDPTIDVISRNPAKAFDTLLSKMVDLLEKNNKLTAEIKRLKERSSEVKVVTLAKESDIKSNHNSPLLDMAYYHKSDELKKICNDMALEIGRAIRDECNAVVRSNVKSSLVRFRENIDSWLVLQRDLVQILLHLR